MSGGQKLSLGRGCNSSATAMHELLHALGFWHEQARADRNLYVEVMWENILEGLGPVVRKLHKVIHRIATFSNVLKLLFYWNAQI